MTRAEWLAYRAFLAEGKIQHGYSPELLEDSRTDDPEAVSLMSQGVERFTSVPRITDHAESNNAAGVSMIGIALRHRDEMECVDRWIKANTSSSRQLHRAQWLPHACPDAGVTGAPPQIVVVQHFDEELKRLVPVK